MTAVLFSAADSEGAPERLHPIALTPSAFTAARARGLEPVSTLALFSDGDHARCVAAGRVALREFDEAAERIGLSPGLLVVVRQAAWYVATITERLNRTVRSFPVRARDKQGIWREAGGIEELIACLMPRILAEGSAHRIDYRKAFWPAAHRALSGLAARRTRRRAPWLLTPGKLKLGFGQAFAQAGLTIAQIRPSDGSARDYLDLIAHLRGVGATFPVTPTRRDERDAAAALAQIDAIGACFSRVTQKAGWRCYRPFLAHNLPILIAVSRAGREVAVQSAAIGAATYEANGWLSAALLDACAQAGLRGIVANHNSHALTGSAIADEVITTLYHQRKHTPHVTDVIDWTPSDTALAAHLPGPKPRQHPVRLPYPQAGPRREGPLRLLHAGNYQNWTDFFPFVAETSDEFVKGLRSLSEVVAGMEGVELTIRSRPKTEVDAAVVREAIQPAANIQVCSTDEDFLRQLAAHDVLVCHFSTTAAQALQIGRPVLFWGSAHRFRQFPAGLSTFAATDADELRAALHRLRDQFIASAPDEAGFAAYRFSDMPEQAAMAAQFLDA